MENYEILKKFDIKITKPRQMIYEVLLKSHEGRSAEEIKDEVEVQGVFINLSTVYRTLELFENLGLIEKYDSNESKYKYLIKKNDHHHTIICDLCKKHVEIDCPMVKIEDLIRSETGFQVLEHHLELKGICKDCKKLLKEKEVNNSNE